MTSGNTAGHRQRLKDRFAGGEDVSRTDEALLELLLCYAIPQKDVQPLAHHLVAEFGGLAGVLEADLATLCQINGIKINSAVLLKLVDWIRVHYSQKAPLSTFEKLEFEQASIFEVPLSNIHEVPPAEKTKSKQKKTKSGKLPKENIPEKALDKGRTSILSRKGSELFAKAVLAEGIELLPKLPDTESVEEIRQFLQSNLPFSSLETRRRYTNYVVRRLFPNGFADQALRVFAQKYAGQQELRDVCFYRFCQVEQLMLSLIDDLVLPAIGTGKLGRDQIRHYLTERNPAARSIKDSAQAIVEAFSASGFVKADRQQLTFAYRNILIPSFAFVLHSEFPEPGMYDISKLENNQAVRTLLWNPDRILFSLYELRNQGIVAKVSEIDNIRQFTTRWNLEQVVAHLRQ
jgi:hypothetical protein